MPPRKRNQANETRWDALQPVGWFPRFFPEHRGKKLFGVLAALDVPEEQRSKALRQGLYVATMDEDDVEIEIVQSDDFVPRGFGVRGLT